MIPLWKVVKIFQRGIKNILSKNKFYKRDLAYLHTYRHMLFSFVACFHRCAVKPLPRRHSKHMNQMHHLTMKYRYKKWTLPIILDRSSCEMTFCEICWESDCCSRGWSLLSSRIWCSSHLCCRQLHQEVLLARRVTCFSPQRTVKMSRK